MEEYSTRLRGPPDGLFLDRLNTFMDKCLADIKAFSERECRPFEETRQWVAEWHSKYLFESLSNDVAGSSQQNNAVKVRSTLYDTSRALESLCEVAGVQSFVLAVDPNDPSDMGFLGGSIMGREFWRGMRLGGEAGAKAFKAQCLRELESQSAPPFGREEAPLNRTSSVSAKGPPAKSVTVKNTLYESVRKALRATSGVRTAEMKWTNPERLDVFGVRVVGWPTSIPALNPSQLKASQNRVLLERLENGTMRFEKLFPGAGTADYAENYNHDEETIPHEADEVDDDFSWAYDADGGETSLGNTIQDPAPAQELPTEVSAYTQTMFSHAMPGTSSWDPDISNSSSSSAAPIPSRKRLRSDSDGPLDI